MECPIGANSSKFSTSSFTSIIFVSWFSYILFEISFDYLNTLGGSVSDFRALLNLFLDIVNYFFVPLQIPSCLASLSVKNFLPHL